MNKKIWLSTPHMGSSEAEYINQAFNTNWIAPLGPNVDGFERDICNFTESDYSTALSSGTAALHLGLILLGVSAGDEVICPTFTFAASANPIIYQGATPIFIDSESDTWNMDPEILKEVIEERISKGKKPKAIIVVHLYGMPAKIDELMAIANRYEIPVLEDAAESIGSTFNGRHVGTFGKLGALSFNGNKIITTSGGGALISYDENLIIKAKFLATQARDEAEHYQHSEIGYNYRLSNICAGIGRGQMEVVYDRIAKRRYNFDFYRQAFASIPEIQFNLEKKGFFSNRWLTCLLIKPVDGGIKSVDIRKALSSENIESRPLWKPMHLQPVFKKYPFYGNGTAENLFNHGLCLPSGSNLSEEDLNRVSLTIAGVFEKVIQ